MPAFSRSAEFAIDKPPRTPCPKLLDDFRCGIHDRLAESGFPGCSAFDCLGAGQHVTATRAPAQRADAFEVVRDLHELLWYVAEVLARPDAAPAHATATALRDEGLRLRDELGLQRAQVDAYWSAVASFLLEASAVVRAGAPVSERRSRELRRADLSGQDLRGRSFTGSDLRGASLLGADLRGATLDRTDLLGADLRGADLRGADLRTALFLTRTQVAGARVDGSTELPPVLAGPVGA
ncbi:pentapeptide repeat-containing protein [Motilibacter peucedani]|uniref:pentapeptide repeat-containing protein n=1 Tax=Motilibacter peucedani TaxID=598650 RepID=UPI001E3FF515|nr:pentapeptide repeat-containing protein [Motilibacter peucedani]